MTQEIIDMAIRAGIPSVNVPSLGFGRVETGLELLVAFAKLVAAKEREECADLMFEIDLCGREHAAFEAIKARGEA
jgi:hypothetical protein